MSRAGVMPIILPEGVGVSLSADSRILSVSGNIGSEDILLSEGVSCEITDGKLFFSTIDGSARSMVLWGTCRSNVNNIVTGVSKGFYAHLDIEGVGFKAVCDGGYLQLSLGFSHDILYKVPKNLDIKCPKPNQIVVSGVKKQEVFMVASDICKIRCYDPYKGKGIVLRGKFVLRKELSKKK